MTKWPIGAMICWLGASVSAAELMTHKSMTISVVDDYQCGPSAQVRLDAEHEDEFHRSRVDMQEVAKISQTYLWLDCDELESLTFEGFVDDERVYQASANKAGQWYLSEGEPPPVESEKSPEKDKDKDQDKEEKEADEQPAALAEANKPTSEPNSTPPPQSAQQATANPPSASSMGIAAEDDENQASYSSLQELRQKADQGQARAQLDLAKGYLDLQGKPSGIEIQQNLEAGMALLEALAESGNAEAMQLMSEAYLKHGDTPVNQSLVKRITGVAGQAANNVRQNAAALLTMKAA